LEYSPDRRGVSSLIATLLLVTLALTTTIVIYQYFMGYITGFRVVYAMGSMALDSASIDSEAGLLTIYIRNTGRTTLTGFVAYIDGIQTAEPLVNPDPLKEGEVGMIQIFSNLSPLRTYEIKLVTHESTVFVFNLKGK